MARWLRTLALLLVLPGTLLPAGLEVRVCACAGLMAVLTSGGACRCAASVGQDHDSSVATSCCGARERRSPGCDREAVADDGNPNATGRDCGCRRLELRTAERSVIAANEVFVVVPPALPAPGASRWDPTPATIGLAEAQRATPTPPPRWRSEAIPLLI